MFNPNVALIFKGAPLGNDNAAGPHQMGAGSKVKVTGKVSGQGKSGIVAESHGSFHTVQDSKGKHMGYYHESDLTAKVVKPPSLKPESKKEWMARQRAAVTIQNV